MLGWLMLLSVLMIIAALCLVVSRDEYELLFESPLILTIFIISFGFSLIFTPTVFIANAQVNQEIRAFENYQELLNETYNNGSIEDTAINIQVVELNKWLAEARAKEETYGIFSFYDGKLNDLQYLKIEID